MEVVYLYLGFLFGNQLVDDLANHHNHQHDKKQQQPRQLDHVVF